MEFKLDSQQLPARIKVVGIGGAGGNAINRMIKQNMEGIEFVAINTDGLALNHSNAEHRIHIGEKETKGLGAGANPKIGEASALESKEMIKKHLEGADMIFLTAGMGGGTGTGASPIVAEIAKELGILTVAVVTKPFSFEGLVRARNAEEGLTRLARRVDTIIVIPNQKLLEILDKKIQFTEAFEHADQILTSATKGISDIILKHGEIQIDFADVKTIMVKGGLAIMGCGFASGNDRAIQALIKAIESPLLEDVSLEGAQGVLVNITANDTLQMEEVEKIMEYVHQTVGHHNEANIIFGTMIDPEMKEELSVTVVATGFDQSHKKELNMEENVSKKIPSITSVPKKMVKPSYEYQNFQYSKENEFQNLNQSQGLDNKQDDLDVPAYIRFGKRKPLK